MTKVEKFKAAHLKEIQEQDAMAYLGEFITAEMAAALERCRHSYTIRVAGRAVACVGLVEFWAERAEAWAIIDRNCKREFLRIHRTVEELLKMCAGRRIEAVVDIGFDAGHRWMELLGFKIEAPLMRAYRPNGGHCSLYARVKNG